MYHWKTEKIDANYETLNLAESTSSSDELLVVLGNSYVDASFNSSNKNENIIRFVVFGMPLIDIVNIVENMPLNTRINNVLVGLGYNYAIPVSANSSSYDKYFTSNPVKSIWSSIPMVRGRSLTSTLVKEDFKCLASSVLKTKCRNNEDMPSPEKTPDAVFKEHQLKIAASTKKRLKEYLPFTSSISMNFMLYIKRLKTACEIRGITLYTYTAPIYKELRNQLNPEIIKEFQSTIIATGISYVDMNLVYSDWGPDMFSNATHVDKSTARDVTTKFLMDYMDGKAPLQKNPN